MSRNDFAAALGALKKPAPMTVDEALAADDPIEEIVLRLARKPDDALSPPEIVFVAVAHFVDEAFDEGLGPTLAGPGGELCELFVEFVRRYGNDELKAIVSELTALFPGGEVPADPTARTLAVQAMPGNDPLETLTDRLQDCEDAIEAALLALVRNNRAAFDLAC